MKGCSKMKPSNKMLREWMYFEYYYLGLSGLEFEHRSSHAGARSPLPFLQARRKSEKHFQNYPRDIRRASSGSSDG